jgi:hypothetical protein
MRFTSREASLLEVAKLSEVLARDQERTGFRCWICQGGGLPLEPFGARPPLFELGLISQMFDRGPLTAIGTECFVGKGMK